MKRVLFLAVILMAAVSAFAQKGQSAAGINIGVAPSLESGVNVTNFEIGAKYQYGITDAIRAEANLNYGFKSKGMDVFTLSANVHYLFNIGSKLTVYPLIGIGYGHFSAGGGVEFDQEEYNKWMIEQNKNNPYFDYTQSPEVAPGFSSSSSSANRFLFNVGVGAEYPITEKFAVGLEVKYQYMKDFNRLPISLGVTYKF